MKNSELLNCFISVKGEMIRKADKSIVGFCFRSFADRFTHIRRKYSRCNCSQQSMQEVLILYTNKIQEKICTEITYIQDRQLDFFQI